MTELARFRVLSLDGGGIRGAYTAGVLATIEEATGKRLVDHFDLIAGTSTGGIIALGLGLGLPAARILEFYKSRGPEIFPSTGVLTRLWQNARRAFRPKHSAEVLQDALREVFGDRRLGESKCRLVIPAYDATVGDVHVFKTAHHPKVLQDYKCRAVEVAGATSAAPTFLPLFRSTWGQRFLDGGLWANCPSTVAVVEASGVLTVPLDQIHLLSVGTTTAPFSIVRRAAKGGVLHYGRKAIELMMHAQERGAHAQSRVLLGDRLLRINHHVEPGAYHLDDARGVEELVARGIYDGRHHVDIVARRFLTEPVEPFQPVYAIDVETRNAVGQG